MKSVWHRFKDFWLAEEVPRWFGFSLVVIYLFGLAAVARFGIHQARNESNALLESSVRYLMQSLASRMSAVQRDAPSERDAWTVCRGELNSFAANVPVRWLRVVDQDRTVLASTRPQEIGETAHDLASLSPHESSRVVWTATLPDTGKEEIIIRSSFVPAHHALAQAGHQPSSSDGNTTAASYYLEGRIPVSAFGSASRADSASTLTVVLVAFGALFALYRRLRAHLRGLASIAGRLQRHGPRIESDLASLRITDGSDKITEAWNRLVSLTSDLSDTLSKREANDELSRVLQRSAGGALAEAIHALPDGILHIVDEERFDYVNSAALRFMGWTAEEARTITLHDAESEGIGARALETIRGALTPQGAFEPKSVVVDLAEGSEADQSSYRLWIVPLHRSERAGECLVVIRDISQQRRSEGAREEFVAQVTHELRTPLTNIRAYAETLSSGMFDDPKVITECYNVITKETRRLSRLIEDILSVSQLEVGSIQLHVDHVDLRLLLEEGVRDVRGLADEKNIDLHLVLPSKMEPIRGDQDKLAVVVNNLLGNAIKYTPSGGTVQIGCQYSADSVMMTVKDNGIGIDPEDQARVFEKFQRGSGEQVQGETGSGIGLYTAREIVRRHNGEIEVISKPNEGSTFMVRIPHRESRAAALSATEEA